MWRHLMLPFICKWVGSWVVWSWSMKHALHKATWISNINMFETTTDFFCLCMVFNVRCLQKNQVSKGLVSYREVWEPNPGKKLRGILWMSEAKSLYRTWLYSNTKNSSNTGWDDKNKSPNFPKKKPTCIWKVKSLTKTPTLFSVKLTAPSSMKFTSMQ